MSPLPTGLETGGDLPYAGQFFDKGAHVFNVMHPDFGAVGDGVADDGIAFNAARAALPANGGTIIVPPGDYLLTTAFTFAAATGVLLWVMPGAVLTGEALPTPAGTNSIIDWSDPSGIGTIGFLGYPILEAQIGTGAVTTVKLGDSSVTSVKIGDAQITTAKIGDSEVTSTKLNDGSVTEAKIGTSAVTVTKIGDASITQVKMGSGLFVPEIVGALPTLPDAAYPQGSLVVLTTDDKLYRSTGSAWTSAVPSTDLSGTIDLGTQISGTLTESFAAAGLINTNVTINADGSLTGAGGGQASLTSLPGSVQVGSIAANAVTAGTIAALAVTAGTIAAGVVTATEIATGTITANEIAAGTITTTQIATDTILAGNIAAGAIGTSELAAGAVIAGKIAAGTIVAADIAAGTITTAELAAGTLAAGNITVGTLIADVIIASASFTNANPVFDGSLDIHGGDGDVYVALDSNGFQGRVSLSYAGTPVLAGRLEANTDVLLLGAALNHSIHILASGTGDLVLNAGTTGLLKYGPGANALPWGPLHIDGTDRASSSVTETTVETITLPQDSIDDGNGVLLEAWGNNEAGSSTLRVKLGVTTHATISGSTNVDWRLRVAVAGTGTAAQTIIVEYAEDSLDVQVSRFTDTKNYATGGHDLVITLQNTGAGDDHLRLSMARFEGRS